MDFYQNIIIFFRKTHTFILLLLFTQQLSVCKSTLVPNQFSYGLSTDDNLGLINYRGEPHTKKEIVKKNAIDTYNIALIDRGMHRKTGLVNGIPVINVPIYWEVDMDNFMHGSKKETKKNDKRKNRIKTVRSYANGKISQNESSSLSGEEKTLSGYSRKIQANKISRDKKHVKTQKDQDNKYQQKSNGKSKRNAVKRIENKAKKNLANNAIHKTSSNNAARMEEKPVDGSSEDSRDSTDSKPLKTDVDDKSPKKSRNVVDRLADDSDDENVRDSNGTNKKSNNTTLDESPSGKRDEDSVGPTNGQHTRRKTNKSSGDSVVEHLRGKAIGNKAKAGKITLVVLGKGQKSTSDKMVDLAKRNKIVESIRRENPEETKSSTYTSDLTKDRVLQPSANSKNKHTKHSSKDNTLLSQDDSDDDSGKLTIVHYRNHHRG